jgi:hypothetical protein
VTKNSHDNDTNRNDRKQRKKNSKNDWPVITKTQIAAHKPMLPCSAAAPKSYSKFENHQ